MDAAGEEAYTRVVTLRVRADEPQENIKERLLGTTLAWQIDAGETQLGEAACVRVYRPMVLRADERRVDGHFLGRTAAGGDGQLSVRGVQFG